MVKSWFSFSSKFKIQLRMSKQLVLIKVGKRRNFQVVLNEKVEVAIETATPDK